VETGENRERDPKETRQRMQMKDNAPCNNQPKEDKKEVNLPPRKLSPKKCFQRTRSKRIPQVPLK
jgi:hypothetical protein